VAVDSKEAISVTVEKKKKIIKTIRVDIDKCHGCRACEVICSAIHAEPKYSSNNPARSRIRVIRKAYEDQYVPVYAGDYAPAECSGREKYTIDGKEYDECAFCKAACPSREDFFEPDSGLPLKCDMCEGEDEPMCVKWCTADALVLEEREEEVEEGDEVEAAEELDIGLESLARKHGLQKVMESLAKMSISKKGDTT
jgi:benzoyl-CoA reductase subunit BamC